MEDLLILVIALACTVLPWVVAQRVGSLPYISPLHIVSILVFFGTTLKVVIFLIRPELGFFADFVSDRTAYIDGLVFVFLFVLFLCCGYALAGIRQRRPALVLGPDLVARLRFRLLLLPLALGVIFAITSLMLAQRGLTGFTVDTLITMNTAKHFDVNADGIGNTGSLFRTFYAVPNVIFIVAVVTAVVTRRKSDRIAAVLIGLALLAIALLSGNRFDLLRLGGYAMIAAVLAGWRIRLRSAVNLVLALGIIVSAAAAMSTFRQGDTLATAQRNPFEELASQVVESTYFMDVNITTILIARMTEDQYLRGSSYMTWTFGWIPRALWPDKPAVDSGIYVKREILGYGANSPGGVNITGPGEAYLNFGWYGVLVGLVLGAAMRRLELFLVNAGPSSLRPILYPAALFLVILSAMQSSLSGSLVAMLAVVPLSVLTIRILFRSPKSSIALSQRAVSPLMRNSHA